MLSIILDKSAPQSVKITSSCNSLQSNIVYNSEQVVPQSVKNTSRCNCLQDNESFYIATKNYQVIYSTHFHFTVVSNC